MISIDNKSTLVTGLPRGGTTWLARRISDSLGLEYWHEPDNEKDSILGFAGKAGVGRFPAVTAVENRWYRELWYSAFFAPSTIMGLNAKLSSWMLANKAVVERWIMSSEAMWPVSATAIKLVGRSLLLASRLARKPQMRVVKSVHLAGALALLNDSVWRDVQLIVVLRNPAAVLASWRRNSMADGYRRISCCKLKSQLPELCSGWFAEGSVEVGAIQQVVAFYSLLKKGAEYRCCPVLSYEACRNMCAQGDGALDSSLKGGLLDDTLSVAGYGHMDLDGRWRSELSDAEIERLVHYADLLGLEEVKTGLR